MDEPRKKVGVMLPSSNTTVEYDFQRAAPANVSIHSARMWAEGAGVDVLEEMNKDVERCARYLGTAAVDTIAYACTGGSLLGGVGFDAQLKKRIEEFSGGIPAVTTSTAVVEAMRQLGLESVCVATPYPADINDKVQAFLEGSGFRVLSLSGRGHTRNLDIGADTAQTILDFVRSRLSAEADGVFLSCTNWGAMAVADELEHEIGRPVVTSNQATIWATFRAIGLSEPMPGYGRLMELSADDISTSRAPASVTG